MEKFPTAQENENEVETRAKQILHMLGLDISYLEGKLTLDVGAGGGELGKFAAEHGHTVVSLDRNVNLVHAVNLMADAQQEGTLTEEEEESHSIPDRFLDAAKQVPKAPKTVQANANMIPFADNSFDLVLVNGVPTITFREGEELKRFTDEMWRVLKENGGELRISPARDHFVKNFTELYPDHYHELGDFSDSRGDIMHYLVAKK